MGAARSNTRNSRADGGHVEVPVARNLGASRSVATYIVHLESGSDHEASTPIAAAAEETQAEASAEAVPALDLAYVTHLESRSDHEASTPVAVAAEETQAEASAEAVPDLDLAVQAFANGVPLHPDVPVPAAATVGNLPRPVMTHAQLASAREDDVSSRSDDGSSTSDSDDESSTSDRLAEGPLSESAADKQADTSAADARELYVAIEAFGSGVLLHAGLTVPPATTVRDLRQLVLTRAQLPPGTRTVRLFVGHGGAELTNDAMLVATSAMRNLAADDALVVFPRPCTSCHSIALRPCIYLRFTWTTTCKPRHVWNSTVVCACLNSGRDEEVLVTCRWCTKRDVATVEDHFAQAVSIKTTIRALKIDFTSQDGWHETINASKAGLLKSMLHATQLVVITILALCALKTQSGL